jgi:hypothetical protein
LEAECNALETEVKHLKGEQEKVNPRIYVRGRGVMKLKREVERLTALCNGMINTKEIMNNENTSPDIDEEKKEYQA